MNEYSKLLDELDSAFCLAVNFVECDIECPQDDDGITHVEGCGCNALIRFTDYEAASGRFHRALDSLRSEWKP